MFSLTILLLFFANLLGLASYASPVAQEPDNIDANGIIFLAEELSYTASVDPFWNFENDIYHVRWFFGLDGVITCMDGDGATLWDTHILQGAYADCSKIDCELKFTKDGYVAIYYDGKLSWKTNTDGLGYLVELLPYDPYFKIFDDKAQLVIWSYYPATDEECSCKKASLKS
jgi:hypothetical protein